MCKIEGINNRLKQIVREAKYARYSMSTAYGTRDSSEAAVEMALVYSVP